VAKYCSEGPEEGEPRRVDASPADQSAGRQRGVRPVRPFHDRPMQAGGKTLRLRKLLR